MGKNMKKMIFRKKYIIIAALGIIIMLLSKGGGPAEKKDATDCGFEPYDITTLERVIQTIDGVKKAEVFISYEDDGEKQIVQQIDRKESGVSIRPEKNGDTYFVVSNKRPQIAGVLVTVSGKVDISVKNNVLVAVKHALGVPYYKISVQIAK